MEEENKGIYNLIKELSRAGISEFRDVDVKNDFISEDWGRQIDIKRDDK